MRHVRVYVSSPGDVADERGLAMTVLDRLQYDPFVRGKASIEIVAWDKAGGGAPLLATESPQTSINKGLPRPSECDVVVVILWSWMGTPMPFPEYQTPDGRPYQSGTEWELTDAMAAAADRGVPYVLLYRRTAKRPIDPDAPDAFELLQQKQRVNEFFRGFTHPGTAGMTSGFKNYETPEEFRGSLEFDLRSITQRMLAEEEGSSAPVRAGHKAPLWPGSPFPGLRAFTDEDAPIFFGRGRETDLVLQRLSQSRFVAVIGASGSGKSSLVGAGVLPRLAAGAIDRARPFLLPRYDRKSRKWRGLRCSPGEVGSDPFRALAGHLAPMCGTVATELAPLLTAAPASAAQLIEEIGAREDNAQVLLFVDQFEELFTLVAPELRRPFIDLLDAIANSRSARVLLTMRSDFYPRCLEIPALARLLEKGEVPLPAPDATLLEMMVGPANRAGLRFEEGLPGRMLADAGAEPGSLPLLAYALDELYRARSEDGVLSLSAYVALGGVAGSIGTRADDVFAGRLDAAARSAFSDVFRELVGIDGAGRATRRRAPLDTVARTEQARRLIDVFTDARLLVTTRDEFGQAIVQVAHEALFTSWHRLAEWIAVVQDDLRLLARAAAAAREWDDDGRRDTYLWPHERLEPIYDAIRRLAPAIDARTEAFIRPEHERLLPLLADPATPPYRRQVTADRLLAIGEPAIPGLLMLLETGAKPARDTAAATLARQGAPALTGLLDACRSPEVEVRLAAIGAVRLIGDERAVPALAAAIRDGDARVRSLASGALEAIGGPAAAEAIAAALQADEVDVRWRAAGLLGAFGPAAIRPLLVALGDADPRVGEQAHDALLAVGAQSLDTLTDALADPETSVRAGAARMLTALGEVAVPAVLAATDREDADLRWRATEVLAGIGSPAAAFRARALATDPEPEVRRAALAALRGDESETLDSLFAALDDRDPDIRQAAAESLMAVGAPAAERIAATLIRARGRSAPMAAAAVRGIGPRAVTEVLSALPGTEGPGRDRAVEALIAGGPEAVATLLAAIPAARPVVQDAAAAALRALGAPALPGLLTLTGHEEAATRRCAALALWGRTDRAVVSALSRLLGDHDGSVRRAAARSLAAIGEPAIPALLAELGGPDVGASEAASEALVAIGGPAVRDLMRIARRSEGRQRDAARHALAQMKVAPAVFGLAELGAG